MSTDKKKKLELCGGQNFRPLTSSYQQYWSFLNARLIKQWVLLEHLVSMFRLQMEWHWK